MPSKTLPGADPTLRTVRQEKRKRPTTHVFVPRRDWVVRRPTAPAVVALPDHDGYGAVTVTATDGK